MTTLTSARLHVASRRILIMQSRAYYRHGRTPISRGAILFAFFVSEGPANPSRLYWTFALSALLLAVLGSVFPCLGQSAQPLTLDEVVAKLQNNLDSYNRSRPTSLADESTPTPPSGISALDRGLTTPPVRSPSSGSSAISTLSGTFRCSTSRGRSNRSTASRQTARRRQPRSTAHSPAGWPRSQDQQACMRYTLVPPKPGKPIIVSFVSAPAGQRPKACVLAEEGSGRVTMDPTSMQITKIEIKVPHHVITPRDRDGHTGPPILTFWEVLVVYKPVVLDAHTFWLPATISSVSSTAEWLGHSWPPIATITCCRCARGFWCRRRCEAVRQSCLLIVDLHVGILDVSSQKMGTLEITGTVTHK